MNIIINTLLELLNRASIKQFLYILYDTKRQNIYKNKSLYKNQIKKNYSLFIYFFLSLFLHIFFLHSFSLNSPIYFPFSKTASKVVPFTVNFPFPCCFPFLNGPL